MFLYNIITVSELGTLRSTMPEKTIVLATGCFDLLHLGHLYFLQEASKQGNVLVIGINSDASVKTLKGLGRPISGEEQRVTLLSTIRYVDLAFVYDNIVADDCILALKPHVYVIGEESVASYPSELAAARNVEARIHIAKRIPGLSTTAIVKDILMKRNV